MFILTPTVGYPVPRPLSRCDCAHLSKEFNRILDKGQNLSHYQDYHCILQIVAVNEEVVQKHHNACVSACDWESNEKED
ncbi:hypothetical protein Plhal304r1_c040g0117481 [Plasmopara halstedii]